MEENKLEVTSAGVSKIEDPVLSLLQMALTDSNVDLSKMEKIMEMVDKHDAKMAKKSYSASMAILQGAMPEIKKDGKILGGDGKIRSEYANYETIMRAIKPALSANGFSVSFNPKVVDKQMEVECIISHKDGHSESSSVVLPFDDSGKKNSVQAMGSSMSYAKRYALCLKLNIPTGGEDNDGNSNPDRSLEELTKMANNCKDKSEIVMLWNGLTTKEQATLSPVMTVRKKELGIK